MRTYIHYSILILFFTLLVCENQAQELDIKWSTEEKYPAKSPEPLFLGDDDEKLYIYKGLKYGSLSNYYIEVVNRKTLVTEKKILLDGSTLPNAQNHYLSKIYFDGKKFFIFSSKSEGKISRVYGSIIDKTGKTLSEGKLLEEIDNKGKKNAGYIEVISDKEMSDFLVFTNVPTEKKDNEKIAYKLFDTNLKERFNKQITLPYKEREFEIASTFIDNQGNIYLLGTKEEKGIPEGTSVVFYYSVTKGTFAELKLPLANRVSSGISIDFDEKQNIILTGLYSNQVKYPDFREGIFYVKMQAETGKVLESRNTLFNLASLKTLGKRLVKENLLSNAFVVKYIYTAENYNMYILELSTNTLVQQNNAQYLVCFRSHMLVVKVDKKGAIIWTSVVPKEQKIVLPQAASFLFVPVDLSSYSDKFRSLLSFTPVFKDNKLYMIYNDHKKNLELEDIDDAKTTNFKSSTACYMATVDEKGKVTRDIMFKSKDEGYWITPDNSKQISENQALLFSYVIEERKAKIGILNLR